MTWIKRLVVVSGGVILLLSLYAWHIKNKPRGEKTLPDLDWMPAAAEDFCLNTIVWWQDGYYSEIHESFLEPAAPQGSLYWPGRTVYVPTDDAWFRRYEERRQQDLDALQDEVASLLRHLRRKGKPIEEGMKHETVEFIDGKWRFPEPARQEGDYYVKDGEWQLWKNGRWHKREARR